MSKSSGDREKNVLSRAIFFPNYIIWPKKIYCTSSYIWPVLHLKLRTWWFSFLRDLVESCCFYISPHVEDVYNENYVWQQDYKTPPKLHENKEKCRFTRCSSNQNDSMILYFHRTYSCRHLSGSTVSGSGLCGSRQTRDCWRESIRGYRDEVTGVSLMRKGLQTWGCLFWRQED